MSCKILVCGGDMRSIYMADLFDKKGYNVQMCMTDESSAAEYDFKYTTLKDGLRGAEIILLGLPAVKNDMTVNCPLSKEKPLFEQILKKTDKKTVIAGGRFSAAARLMAADYGITLLDYSSDEVFQIENAFYTAEGAVEAIIKNTVRSLGELKILVAGYGRISRALTKFLIVLGSDITVYARKAEQRAWAKMHGMETIDTIGALDKYDVVINTAPSELFGRESIATAHKCVLFVDLSARPGYVSREICEECGAKLIFLPGLPAVSAPRSAGEAAARAVIRMYNSIQMGDVHNGA